MPKNRNTNITIKLSRIFKTFEDFRLVQQIREEIRKRNRVKLEHGNQKTYYDRRSKTHG